MIQKSFVGSVISSSPENGKQGIENFSALFLPFAPAKNSR